MIDDDISVRSALEDLLASVGLEVRTFASIRQFLTHQLEDIPSCLILDVRMPEQSGMDFHRKMEGLGLNLPVVFITGHGDIAMSVKAIKAGAIEFLTKPFRDQELLDAIHQGIEQNHAQRQQDAIVAKLRSCWLLLNEGEREVVKLVVQGLLNKQIAYQLGLSEVTVKVRRSNAMRKMRANSLANLVRLTEKIGL
ncbi:response regulator transcription factor [Serratia ureilytica]|uniref:response regulator transcription factor n=1 Tax=Serratia TaxID=613 RepID=UPI00313DD663